MNISRSTLFVGFLLLSSFNQQDTNIDSVVATSNLIQTAINATLKLDPGTTTKEYFIDFSKDLKLNKNAINLYLKRNKNASRVNANSLFKHDPTWIKEGYFKKSLVQLVSIELQKDGTILVKTSKTIASDGANGAEIVLKQHGNDYELLSSKITWIS